MTTITLPAPAGISTVLENVAPGEVFSFLPFPTAPDDIYRRTTSPPGETYFAYVREYDGIWAHTTAGDSPVWHYANADLVCAP